MSTTKTNGNDLERIIADALDKYRDKCGDTIRDVIKDTAKEATKKLKKEAPRGSTKKYYKGWGQKVTSDEYTVESVVYGKKPHTWALAHLLEHGHAKRGGGRTKGIVHIKPVEEWAVDDAIRKIRRSLS